MTKTDRNSYVLLSELFIWIFRVNNMGFREFKTGSEMRGIFKKTILRNSLNFAIWVFLGIIIGDFFMN